MSEKLEKLKKFLEEKKRYNEEYKPLLTKKFAELFDSFSEVLRDLDLEVTTDISVPAESKKYRSKGCAVSPALIKIKDEIKFCLVYKNDKGFREVLDARSAPLVDIIAVSTILGEFKKVVEEAVIDTMLRREEEERERIKNFMKRCSNAFELYVDVLDAIKSIRQAIEGENDT